MTPEYRKFIYDGVKGEWPKISYATQEYSNLNIFNKLVIQQPMPVRFLRNDLVHNYDFDRLYDINFYDENDEYLGLC